MFFEVGLDAADDHVGQFGHGVQNLFVDGGGFAQEHAGADPARASTGEQLRLPVPAQVPARPMNDTTPSLAPGMLFSMEDSPRRISTPSMVENTWAVD
jgi:hypothetical protein